jgi:uncharacterized protein (TIGR02391 family)
MAAGSLMHHRSLTVDLHPAIRARVRRLFLMGEIEPALVAALRQVEIEVRRAAGADKADIGKRLMALAFKSGEGRLVDPALEPSEQEGVMQLYLGLIGAFKTLRAITRWTSTISNSRRSSRLTRPSC